MIPLYVAIGGALGALARYGLAGWVHDWAGARFPWGTFAVNVLGCLLVGFAVRALEGVLWGPEARAFLAIGVLGGFTTFSTFGYETIALLEGGEWARAGLYAFGSLGLGLAAVLLGLGLAGLLLQARG